MGQCCGKQAQPETGPQVYEEVLSSLSFIEGLKVTPSLAVLGSSDSVDTAGDGIFVHSSSTGSLFFACMFVGIGPASCAAARSVRQVVEASAGEAHLKVAAEEALTTLFTQVHSVLLKAGKTQQWAVGVALVGDLRQKTVTVASVGCCHALLCQVTGSFTQAAADGAPLTEAEEYRSLISALVNSPTDPTTRTAALGHVLGLRMRSSESQPSSRRATSQAGEAPAETTGAHGLHIKIKTSSLTAPSPFLVLMSDAMAANLSVPNAACLAHHFSPSHIQLLRDAAANAPPGGGARPPRKRGTTTTRPTATHRAGMAAASPTKATPGQTTVCVVAAGGADAAARKPHVSPHSALPLEHQINSPRAVQPASPRQARPSPIAKPPAITTTTKGAPHSPAGRKPAVPTRTPASPTSRARSTGSGLAQDKRGLQPRSPPSSPGPKFAPPKPSCTTSPAPRGPTAPKSTTPSVSKTPPALAGAPVGASGDAGALVAMSPGGALVPTVHGPRFNPARLMLHHALAQPELLRLKRTRDRGAWRRHVLASAAAVGVHLPAPPPPPARGGSSGSTTTPSAADTVVPVVVPAGPPAVLVLSLQWPLSVTSQQVALMRAVAANRATNPRAEYWWHMVRQLVHHMGSRQRRVQQAWNTTLSLAFEHMLQQKRAAEVLAWKHLGEAVVVTRGGSVMRSMASPPAAQHSSPVQQRVVQQRALAVAAAEVASRRAKLVTPPRQPTQQTGAKLESEAPDVSSAVPKSAPSASTPSAVLRTPSDAFHTPAGSFTPAAGLRTSEIQPIINLTKNDDVVSNTPASVAPNKGGDRGSSITPSGQAQRTLQQREGGRSATKLQSSPASNTPVATTEAHGAVIVGTPSEGGRGGTVTPASRVASKVGTPLTITPSSSGRRPALDQSINLRASRGR